jgi:hypothetical protein
MRQRGVYRRPQPSDPLPTWAIFVPTPIPGQPDSVGESAISTQSPPITEDPIQHAPPEGGSPEDSAKAPTTQAAGPSDTKAEASNLEAPAPEDSARRLELQRIPPQARPLVEEFASSMGENLLAVSPIRCSWPDCQFPVTVLIKTVQVLHDEVVYMLVWGCPRCGREYQPKVLNTQQFGRIETSLFGKQRESPQAPEEASTPDVQAQAQRLLDFGKRHGWPALRITPWCTLPGGEFNWRRFAEHLAETSTVPLVEVERRRMFALAIAALEASEKQGCSPAGTRLPRAEQAQNRP